MSYEMKCPLHTEQTDLLLDDAAGTLARRELDGEAMASLMAHMAACPECAAFRRDQKTVWEALDLWEPAPVSMDFNRRLWQRIDAAAAAPWYKKLGESLRAHWKPMIPLAAAVLVVAGGFLLDHPGAGHPGARKVTPGVSIIEADQVEQTLDDIQLLRQFDTGTGGSQAGQQKTQM